MFDLTLLVKSISYCLSFLHLGEAILMEDDSGMEEGAGDAGGDGEKFGLAAKTLIGGAGRRWGGDRGGRSRMRGGGGFVGGDGGESWAGVGGVNEEGFY